LFLMMVVEHSVDKVVRNFDEDAVYRNVRVNLVPDEGD
jgi:hypothetical protein